VPHFLDRGNNDAGLILVFVAVVFCLAGLWSLWARRPEAALLLLSPLLFMLVAWGLHKYPTLGRTQLFLVPSFVLLLAEGIVFALRRVRQRGARLAVLVCAVTLGVAMVLPSLGHATDPRRFEDLKPVLAYLARHERGTDALYVYYTAQYQLRYYLECGCGGRAFEDAREAGRWPYRPEPGGAGEFAPALLSVPPRLIVGTFRGRDPLPYVSDLEALRGRRRVWFLLSSLEDQQRAFLLAELDKRGARRAAFLVGKGKDAAGVYLYDMTRPAG
jgi:hypothetical protein